MSGIEIVATAVKDRAHSFNSIHKTTGLPLSDEQLRELIQENEDRLQITRIRREDSGGHRLQPGWPGVKRRGATTG